MKKIAILITILLTGFVQFGFSQDTQLLPSYFAVKDALVADNSGLAAVKAGEWAKQLSATDSKLTKKDYDVLLKNITQISESKDINNQRERFAAISNSLIAIAKASKRSDKPVYVMYCPMKKSTWLSGEKGIKNPYYGKSMLTCGSVTQTLN